MCAKKNANYVKNWKIAGEISHAAPLKSQEQAQITLAFLRCDCARRDFSGEFQQGSRAEAKRNQSAAQAMAAFLCEHYADQYSRETVVDVVAISASIPFPLETQLEEQQSYLWGGTLWLLDYLKEHCNCAHDYLSLLPEPDGELECDMPFLADLGQSRDTIIQTMTVLCGRKKRYRKAFRALLNLIDDESAAQLRKSFLMSFLDYMDRIMKANSCLQPAKCDFPFDAEDVFQAQDTLERLTQRPLHEKFLVLGVGPQLICHPVSEIQELVQSKRVAEMLSSYSTADPYALCAAYLLLEDEQDALASMSALTAAVVSCAANHLPWARDEFIPRKDLFEPGTPDYTLRLDYQESCSTQDTPFTPQLISEAQLFFNITRVVMPRHRQPSQQLIKWFMDRGVSEQRARELAWGAMFAYYTDAGGHIWEDADCHADAECVTENTVETVQQEVQYDAELIENQSAEIEALTRKEKELRSALHDAEQEAKHLRDELHDAVQKGEADRLELAQLRETLYNLKSEEVADVEDSNPLVELPWPVKRRVAVFGGHDSWRKLMKPLLPGARFYDRDVLIDLNVVRGADVIWLQVNSMAHSYYNRIIDTARTSGVAVRYFSSASPKRCAMQLVLEEMAEDKDRSGA